MRSKSVYTDARGRITIDNDEAGVVAASPRFQSHGILAVSITTSICQTTARERYLPHGRISTDLLWADS